MSLFERLNSSGLNHNEKLRFIEMIDGGNYVYSAIITDLYVSVGDLHWAFQGRGVISIEHNKDIFCLNFYDLNTKEKKWSQEMFIDQITNADTDETNVLIFETNDGFALLNIPLQIDYIDFIEAFVGISNYLEIFYSIGAEKASTLLNYFMKYTLVLDATVPPIPPKRSYRVEDNVKSVGTKITSCDIDNSAQRIFKRSNSHDSQKDPELQSMFNWTKKLMKKFKKSTKTYSNIGGDKSMNFEDRSKEEPKKIGKTIPRANLNFQKSDQRPTLQNRGTNVGIVDIKKKIYIPKRVNINEEESRDNIWTPPLPTDKQRSAMIVKEDTTRSSRPSPITHSLTNERERMDKDFTEKLLNTIPERPLRFSREPRFINNDTDSETPPKLPPHKEKSTSNNLYDPSKPPPVLPLKPNQLKSDLSNEINKSTKNTETNLVNNKKREMEGSVGENLLSQIRNFKKNKTLNATKVMNQKKIPENVSISDFDFLKQAIASKCHEWDFAEKREDESEKEEDEEEFDWNS